MKKETITEDFQKIFIDTKTGKNDSPLAKANDNYNELVSKGIIKKRGYTLRGIEDAHLFQLKFNSR